MSDNILPGGVKWASTVDPIHWYVLPKGVSMYILVIMSL